MSSVHCRALNAVSNEAHLATCERCRSAVAEISGIPALLGDAGSRGRACAGGRNAGNPAASPRGSRLGPRQGSVAPQAVPLADVGAVGVAAALARCRCGHRHSSRDRGSGRTTPPRKPSRRWIMNKVSETPDQRIDLADRLRLGHPHRHGLARTVTGARRQHRTTEPRHGRGGP